MFYNFYVYILVASCFARVAQLEEQRPSKAKVTGSNPVSCTINILKMGD